VAEAYEVVDQIARHNTLVTVQAIAARDVWVYDSLDVRFELVVQQ